jgi:hypothetical protein
MITDFDDFCLWVYVIGCVQDLIPPSNYLMPKQRGQAIIIANGKGQVVNARREKAEVRVNDGIALLVMGL